MIHFFLNIYDWLRLHKWIAVLSLVLCIVVCFVLISTLHYQEDISAFLTHDKRNEKITEAYQHIGGQNKIVIAFHSPTGSEENADSLVAAMESFGENWQKADTARMIKTLQIRVNDSATTEMLDFIYQNYPYFLSEADYVRMDSLLAQPHYIAQQLEKDKQLLMLPVGGTFSDNIQVDPLHLFTPVLKRMQSFQLSDKYNLYDGCIFTDKWRKGLVFLDSPFGMSESEQNGKLATLIDHVIQTTRKAYPHIQISAVGAPLIAVTNAQQIKRDGIWAVSVSVLLIFALLFFAFRRVGDLLWIIASIVFGWLFALAGMAVYSDELSIIVLGISSVIIGIAVNYPLHFLDHLKHTSDKRQALKEMVPPLLIGNITTVGAFLCLAWMNAQAMRDLGVFGSLVMIGTILFVLVYLPLFVRSRKHTSNNNTLTFGKLASFSLEKKKYLFWPVMILTVLFAILSMQTSFDSNLQHINYMTDQQRQDLDLLSGNMQKKGQTSVYALAEGQSMEEALEHNEEIQRQIERLTAQQAVTSVSGIGDFIPSAQKQQESIRHWESFWNKYRQKVISELQKKSIEQGFAIDAFAPFENMLNRIYRVQPVSYFAPIQKTVGANFVSQKKDKVSIINFVQVPYKQTDRVKQALNVSPHSFAFDQSDVGSNYVDALSFDFNYVGYACGFIVFFFLWLSFGRMELSLISFLPLAVSWLWILGIMQLLGIQFNIVNIILATFIFGQGDDYTIFITEGLISEYAYGKKLLSSYKNSVALSALIMFIGMGTLVFAKHPAMRSLGEVTIIGMFTVVLMAYYFPPLIYKWITTVHGKKREIPQTLQRLGYSLFALLFFLFSIYLIWFPYTFINFHIGRVTEKKRLKFHRFMYRSSQFIIRHVPGVKFSYDNQWKESFEKPAVIICNHQSHLDLMALLMLTPKMVILTKDWVWNNPFYGKIIHHAEFYPVSDGIEANLGRLKNLVDRGYSVVIFPEGTRSEDGRILRFHHGAFYLAEKLQLDILPIFIHGVSHVLPKTDFMLRKGSIYMEIGKRVTSDDTSFGPTYKERTHAFRRYYREHIAEIARQKEDTVYFLSYLKYKYMYKGRANEAHCKKVIRKSNVYKQYIEADYASIHTVWIMNSGAGEFAWLFALVNKEIEVYAFEADEDKYLLAANGSFMPSNLHFCRYQEEALTTYPQPDKCLALLDSIYPSMSWEKYNPQWIPIR